MQPFRHKAKLAFLMTEETPTHFYQLDDGRILMIEVTEGQVAGFVADGAKRLALRTREIGE